MNVKKIILSILCASVMGAVFASEENVSSGGMVLGVSSSVLENGLADGSDMYAALSIRQDVLRSLKIFSSVSVVEGKVADYSVSLVTSRVSVEGKSRYNVSASIYSAKEKAYIGGAYSSRLYTIEDFVSNAYIDVVQSVFQRLNLPLSPAEQRLLAQDASDSLVSAYTLEQVQENVRALEAISARNFAGDEDLRLYVQKKLNIEQIRLSLASRDAARLEKEAMLNASRSSEERLSVLNGISRVQGRADSIAAVQSKGPSSFVRLMDIEAQKRFLFARSSDLAFLNAQGLLNSDYEREVAERIARTPRAAETEADGVTLNERGRLRLEQDLKDIAAKYGEKSEAAVQSEALLQGARSFVSGKLPSVVRDYSSTVFTASSVCDGNILLRFGEYDGTTMHEGWPYELTFYFGGDPVYTASGFVSYEEVTGKSVPPLYGEGASYRASYDEYLSCVDLYSSMFHCALPVVEAQLDFCVKAEGKARESKYSIEVRNVRLLNLETGRSVLERVVNVPFAYQFRPASSLDEGSVLAGLDDLTAGPVALIPSENGSAQSGSASLPAVSSVPVNDSLTSELKNGSKQNAGSGRNDLAVLFYCLPGTLNFYTLGEDTAVTVGYQANFSCSENWFLGVNIEFPWMLVHPDEELVTYDGSYDSSYELDDKYTISGVLGYSFMLGSHLRTSIYAEAGYICGSMMAGLGSSLEFLTGDDSGFFGGFTYLVGEDDLCVTRISLGYEVLF